MKQLARYKVNFESQWICASVALMGTAFFAQALYFFALTRLEETPVSKLIIFLILPTLLEILWFVLLRTVKLNASGIFGILASVFCILLTVQVFFIGGVLQMVLAVIAYLLASALTLMITGGFFPYKYLGMACFALIFCVRFLGFDMARYIHAGDWIGFVQEIPALCILAAISCFFGGITGIRKRA